MISFLFVYFQLVAMERALIDECFELERCRKQLEAIQNDTRKKRNPRNERFQVSSENNAYTDDPLSIEDRNNIESSYWIYKLAKSARIFPFFSPNLSF